MMVGVNLVRVLACTAIALQHILIYIDANVVTQSGIRHLNLAGPGFHIFLLVSGFILVLTTPQDATPGRFLIKRTARIVPLYWLLTLAAIGLTLIRPWLMPAADLSIWGVISSFLFLPNMDGFGHIQPILFVGWTLNYLMLFYLIYAGGLWLARRKAPLVAIAAVPVLIALAKALPEGEVRAFYGDPILMEFAAGVCVGVALVHPRVADWIRTHPVWPLTLVGGIGLVAATLQPLGPWMSLLVNAPFGAMVVFGLGGQDLYRKPFKGAGVARFGNYAYAVYLAHPLILPLTGALVAFHVAGGMIGGLLIIVLTLALTFLAAPVLYHGVERPANRWLRSRLLRPSEPAAAQARAEPQR